MYFWSFFLWNCWLFMLLNCKAKAQDILPVKRLTSPVRKNCTKSLVDFAEAVSNYTYCAIQSSRPFRFCGNCKSYYTSALDEHGAIENRCGNELSVGEKYQIVESSNSFVVKLWERSNCPRCFDADDKGLPTDIKVEVATFFQKMNKAEGCFHNYSKIHISPVPVANSTNHSVSNASSINNVCAPCKAAYDDLRDSYQKIIETADSQETKVCADVSAAMTFIRQQWSDDFHCLKIYKDLVSVVALTCFFCFLPIIFYSSVKLNGDAQTKKKRVPLRINYAGSHSADNKS